MICFTPKTECLVIEAFDNTLLVTVDDNIYHLRELNLHKKISTELNLIQNDNKEKIKYTPPMSHPWKASSFKKQIEKAHTNKVYT